MLVKQHRVSYNLHFLAIMVKSLRFADGVEVPVPGFGAMGISFALGNNLSYEEAEPVLLKALELGCTFWDTAVGLISSDQGQHLR